MNTPIHNAKKHKVICQACNEEFMGKRKKKSRKGSRKMTELEAKLYWLFKERLKVLAPMRGVEITEDQLCRISTDLAIMAATVLVKENATNYQGKR